MVIPRSDTARMLIVHLQNPVRTSHSVCFVARCDTFKDPPMFSSGSPGSKPPYISPKLKLPKKRNWMRRLPRIVKKSKHYNPSSSFIITDPIVSSTGLLALFGRRIAPTILIELQEDPAPPTPIHENPAKTPPMSVQEDLVNIPPAAVQEEPQNTSLATQGDPVNMSLTTPQQQISPPPVAYEVD